MSADLAWMTIEQIAPLVAARQVSPRELVETLLARIQGWDTAERVHHGQR